MCQFDKDSQLAKVFPVLRERKIPFVIFRLPHETQIRLLIQYKSSPRKLNAITGLGDESGFVIAPFPLNNNDEIYLLQADLDIADQHISDEVIGELSACTLFNELHFPENTSTTTLQTDFCNQVEEAVDAIQKLNLYKVILSKIRTEKKMPGFLPEKLFEDLCSTYPHALVYYWQIPGAGNWMGATPEPVLREQNGQIYTVSLAGTQLLNNQPLSEVCWREKEIAEQAIVSRFIVQLIDKLGVEKFNIIGPHNFQAGNLVHLNTGFEFEASQLQIPRGEFIAALHPTPSIAGLPRDKAMQFIQMHELHSRSYYAGLLGPYRLQDETHLYVNLRCMQLFEDDFVLYSGAGITGGSVPEREWEETENKMMTLLKVIHAQTGC